MFKTSLDDDGPTSMMMGYWIVCIGEALWHMILEGHLTLVTAAGQGKVPCVRDLGVETLQRLRGNREMGRLA